MLNKPCADPVDRPARDRAGICVTQPPRWMTVELIEHTRNLFARLYNRLVSREEAVTILADVGRLLDALIVRGKPS